jgi:hypothetical protein
MGLLSTTNICDLGGIFKKYVECAKYALIFGVKPSQFTYEITSSQSLWQITLLIYELTIK